MRDGSSTGFRRSDDDADGGEEERRRARASVARKETKTADVETPDGGRERSDESNRLNESNPSSGIYY